MLSAFIIAYSRALVSAGAGAELGQIFAAMPKVMISKRVKNNPSPSREGLSCFYSVAIGISLLSGNMYCGHCGARLALTSRHPPLGALDGLTCFFFIFGRDAARLVNAAGRVYDADLADIARRQEEIWEGVRAILTRPASIF